MNLTDYFYALTFKIIQSGCLIHGADNLPILYLFISTVYQKNTFALCLPLFIVYLCSIPLYFQSSIVQYWESGRQPRTMDLGGRWHYSGIRHTRAQTGTLAVTIASMAPWLVHSVAVVCMYVRAGESWCQSPVVFLEISRGLAHLPDTHIHLDRHRLTLEL